MKKIIIFILTLLTILSLICINTFAYTVTTNTVSKSIKPTTGTESLNPNEGKGSIKLNYPVNNQSIEVVSYDAYPYTNYLLSGNCSISQSSCGSVTLYADTSATTIVSELDFTITLQIWDGYNWSDVKSVYASNYNSPYIDGYFIRDVLSNRYYRVVSNHHVYNNGCDNYATATSDYIYTY